MLRAYVVMGAGNLADEMVRLAAMLTEADVSAQRTMQLHVQVLEELSRFARQPQCAARDDAGRSVGAGNHGPSGRWLSAAIP